MKAFDIKVNGKILDYRKTKKLDFKEVKKFFGKDYTVKKIWQENRHVLGILEKEGTEVFLKLSTTQGIGAVTQIESKWNEEFNKVVNRNKNFWVPKNIDSGFYKENLFYIITDYFKGSLLAKRPAPGIANEEYKKHILSIIELSELIQTLEIKPISEKDLEDYTQWFLNKTVSWYEAVPLDILEKYEVNKLLDVVKDGYLNLNKKPRHGDFTPWHMFKLENGKLGLIDGEHAMKNSVEYYDIGYLIQRVYSVLEDPQFAKEILEIILKRNYSLEKLKTILAARAIGGFTDEALINEKADFNRANRFKDFVLNLKQ